VPLPKVVGRTSDLGDENPETDNTAHVRQILLGCFGYDLCTFCLFRSLVMEFLLVLMDLLS
jgi:hypothetical protein